ncbi:hypothetical protein NEUTE1DRAFT_90058 [Neurospora tetrasperma FGSC 2508]|uniref:SRR1-like domain-containing protein n=1 Tax=Neurospora tetrasperma (strain FGSC 2508 / ATCC MYA-4615 / P0657) TaxID=510951 RepID=F8N081_NEUT8|nr:uncharacterized protein NEUTE1DRAFT_90058 [Neurospora tetrasperma FGSC 2508]EGO52112.1 hypothetical protein NEUTE1DRAFT_90058 [Neurospora tetrasperma FGSC 2508]
MPQQDEEWSQVSRKRGRIRNVPKPKTDVDESKENGLGIRPNPNPEFTVSDIHKHHNTARQEWQISDCWKTLKDLLATARSESNHPLITKAICFGPGPYDPSNGSFAARRTAHMQTAAFCAIVDFLESQCDHKIKRVIQEPMFTQIDKDFCVELGFEVADTPDAFSMVDEHTLVYGIHMELRTYYLALATLPATFIGGGLEEWEKVVDFDPSLNEFIGPISKMDATYTKYPFPDMNYIFSSTTMYWRKGDDAPNIPGSPKTSLQETSQASKQASDVIEALEGLKLSQQASEEKEPDTESSKHPEKLVEPISGRKSKPPTTEE